MLTFILGVVLGWMIPAPTVAVVWLNKIKSYIKSA